MNSEKLYTEEQMLRKLSNQKQELETERDFENEMALDEAVERAEEEAKEEFEGKMSEIEKSINTMLKNTSCLPIPENMDLLWYIENCILEDVKKAITKGA